jgi:hypothetical protein
MRKLRSIPIGMVLVGMAIQAALAQTPERAKLALNNTQHEMTECSAYYTVMRRCIGSERNPKLYEDTSELITRLNELAFKTGRSVGMTQDAMLSRLRMSLEGQMSLINYDCVNVSSLMSRYADRCKFVAERPDEVLAEYLKK